MVMYVPARGDIVWIDFNPQKGKEIKKTWPALVISKIEYNRKTGLGIFMPITRQIKGYPFELVLSHDEVKGGVLVDQIRCLDWKSRNCIKITSSPKAVIDVAIQKLKILII